MAEFRTMVITNKGQALIAKMLAGKGNIEFTKISLSETAYTDAQILALTSLGGVKQTTGIAKVTKTGNAAVQVEGAVTNSSLSTGYYIRTIALHAKDPNDDEIVYAACGASTPGWMPPYNGVSTSGAFLKLVTTVQNASNVTVTVDPAAVATVGDIQDLQNQIDELQAFIGYTKDDIYGVEVDFVNKKFTRLAGAANRTAGKGFDSINAFGGRKRCNLTNDGKVIAYYGDTGFTTTGKLTRAVTVGEGDAAVTYPVGTIVQVMVEQPKFYYKVVPIDLEIINEGENQGYHIRKARYYISETPKPGFKIHPAFVRNGKVNDFIYLAAFEGSLWDSSAGEYILDDAQVADFAIAIGTGDMLSSVSKAKPISGSSQNLTRKNARLLSENRGAGWGQSHATTIAASQLLMLIEYASFDMQSVLGDGNVNKNPSTSNVQCTGLTDSLGNISGKEVDAVSYRGEENFWGNVWTWVDGLNVQNPSMFTTHKVSTLYVSADTLNDDTSVSPYEDTGIHPCYSNNAYISSFGYSEKFDWLFIPTECNGNSSLPVGDGMLNNSSGWRTIAMGGYCANNSNAGAFCLTLTPSSVYKAWTTGGRLVYIPSKGGTEK